jgi:hypothetical protein
METSPLPVKGFKILAYAQRSRAFEQGRVFIVPLLL